MKIERKNIRGLEENSAIQKLFKFKRREKKRTKKRVWDVEKFEKGRSELGCKKILPS